MLPPSQALFINSSNLPTPKKSKNTYRGATGTDDGHPGISWGPLRKRERREGEERGAGTGGDRGGKRQGWPVGKEEQVRVGCQPEAEGQREPEDVEEEEGSEKR